MGKGVDSQALEGLNRALGLAGPGSGQTSLEDGELIQTIDTQGIIRRSRGIGSTSGGWFTGIMENDHEAGATNKSTRINPYTTIFYPPLPAAGQTIPQGYDWWLIGAGLVGTAGTASNFTSGILVLDCGVGLTGFFEDDDSASATGQSAMIPVSRWDDLVTIGGFDVGLREDGNIWTPINLRLPQHIAPVIDFLSTATNAVTVRCNLVMGLFPAQIGQDVSF